MKSFVAILALVAVAAADVSHIVGHHPDTDAQIVSQDADVLPDKFQYAYETSNGIKGQETGALRSLGPDGEGIAVQGSNSYISPDGQVIETQYVADENGYRAQGAHIPTPVPIPEYIVRALDWIAAHPPKVETKYQN